MQSEAETWTAGEARAAFATAPQLDLADLAPNRSLLIIAPHPDDETLGCGGLIAEAAAAGCHVTVALMTDGAGSHPGSPRFDAEGRAALRREELRQALAALSDARIEIAAFGAQDGGLQTRLAEAGEWLRGVAQTAGAPSLFVTWDADHHPDHKASFAAASTAAEATGLALWAYPVWSLILPDDAAVGPRRRCVSFDVRRQAERKRTAIARHASQLDAAVMADPNGFLLRPEDVERHAGDFEVYLAIREPA